MQSVLEHCKALWPAVSWTGGGSQHASRASYVAVPYQGKSPKEIMALVLKEHFIEDTWKRRAMFLPHIKVFATPKEFATIALHGFLTSFGAGGMTDSLGKVLVNPVTENVFGVVGGGGGLSLGVRFWCARPHTSAVHLYVCQRWRIEATPLSQEDLITKAQADQSVVDLLVSEQMTTFEIPEPPMRRVGPPIRIPE